MFHLSSHPSCCKDFGGQRSLTPQRHPAPSCHVGCRGSAVLCCSWAGSCRSLLHSTRTFGVCWPGPQHRGCFSGAITCETPLLWGLQKDFLVLPAFPFLCGCVPSGWRVHSELLCHVPSREAPQAWDDLYRATSRQICCSSFDTLQTPVVNSTAPWLWALPHMPSLLWTS